MTTTLCDECREPATLELKYNVFVADLADGDRDGTYETIHACSVDHAGMQLATRSGKWIIDRFGADGAGKLKAKAAK